MQEVIAFGDHTIIKVGGNITSDVVVSEGSDRYGKAGVSRCSFTTLDVPSKVQERRGAGGAGSVGQLNPG